MHELIAKTYDIVSSAASADGLMSEIAGFFAAGAAALIHQQVGQAPNLVCYGTIGAAEDKDRFFETLQSDISDADLLRLAESQFSVKLSDVDNTTYTMILRNADSGDNENRRQVAALFLPHLVRSIKIARSINSPFPDTREAVGSLKRRLAPATIALDEDGRVVEINEKATSLIQACSAVSLVQDRLEFLDVAAAQGFGQCLSSLQTEESKAAFFVPVVADDEKDSLILSLRKRDGSAGVVEIYLRSMRIPDGELPERFSEKFGLSSRESRLATGLMHGKNLQQLAAEFHVSRHTLRTQLKSMLRKTGANSQIALIMLILADSAITLE